MSCHHLCCWAGVARNRIHRGCPRGSYIYITRCFLHLRHMDSLPDMSLGRLEKNLEDCDNSSTLSQASFDSQLNGFRLTCDIYTKANVKKAEFISPFRGGQFLFFFITKTAALGLPWSRRYRCVLHTTTVLLCWSVGWLVGWFVYWLINWLIDRLVGWLIGWLVGWLVG